MKPAAKILILPVGLLLALAVGIIFWATMAPAEPPQPEVVMELTLKDEKVYPQSQQLYLGVTNQGEEPLYHGNVGYAARLQQKGADGEWRGANGVDKFTATTEGYTLAPGQTYSGTFSFAPYGELSDGDYRIVFFLDRSSREAVSAAAEFAIQNVKIVLE